MKQQNMNNIQAYKILEQYDSGAITIEEALEAYNEIEETIDERVALRIRRILCECHSDEIIKDLPQTD